MGNTYSAPADVMQECEPIIALFIFLIDIWIFKNNTFTK